MSPAPRRESQKAEYQKVEKSQLALFDSPPAWKEHWKGMPEFVQDRQEPYCTIVMRFRNESDLQEFASLIGQKLNRKSQSSWYPELAVGHGRDEEYHDDSALPDLRNI